VVDAERRWISGVDNLKGMVFRQTAADAGTGDPRKGAAEWTARFGSCACDRFAWVGYRIAGPFGRMLHPENDMGQWESPPPNAGKTCVVTLKAERRRKA